MLAATEEETVENEESVQLSLFMSFTAYGRSTKLQTLIREAAECAVLGSGCSNVQSAVV